jgi:hypothetical protein
MRGAYLVAIMASILVIGGFSPVIGILVWRRTWRRRSSKRGYWE